MSKSLLIAIVDDDVAVRAALFDLLEVEGLPARTFESGTSLLAEGAPEGFDCVITDVRMPEIDGLELQQRLRAHGSAIPVIFITSSRDETMRAQALRDGAAAWFTKPVANGALLAALRLALGRRDAGNAHGAQGE